MNLKQIQELIKFVAKSGATEVDLEMGDVKICIKSPPKGKIVTDLTNQLPTQVPAPIPAPIPVAPVVESAPPPSNASSNTESDESASIINNDTAASENHEIIKSPIIGTFYRRPGPDKDPFINVGDKIEKGSVVGIVEAMKLFNEIESDLSGTIVKVLVEDMSPVEYDQPLFLVDKS
jgi:acetyl-CoA carboxylase biotin carboxyl carrier protein